MTLSYEVDNKLKALSPILDEHSEWFGRVVRWAYYPEAYDESQLLSFPDSYKSWCSQIEGDDLFQKSTISKLTNLHNELHDSAKELLRSSVQNAGGKPPIALYDSFVDRYDEFIAHMRRLEMDCMQADSGIDSMTGLRSKKAMMKDLAKEMERRARHGRPFSLALARIDKYEYIKSLQSDEQHQTAMRCISGLIFKCIRSFDDAYRASDDEFIMSLKHANMSGGTAAIARLRRFMEEEGPQVVENDKEYPITMSYCVAEPVPGDDVNSLLSNMRADLDRYDEKGDTSLEYIEVSPLKRFIDDSETNIA
jgi:diguanylate cyclase (GGDEF)-like protein